ncbi:MAG: bifunctional phosphopantothenoylcysteine decarboxylase/phosphopantothenate--cysteine ligase CoaBC [Gemmatimonadota bacterium]|nr:bifunctional phosphopantothenoylcysteine decarboxylase/phosphopantothenate--cysteine ligase CoaBC [Gemmatimonadota bacterium]
MRPFDGRRVLLVVSGGIAAYKSAILARRLIEAGASVDVILTESAERFVGAVTFEGITARPVHTSVWDRPMAHLELGKRADVAVVAPATAETLARLAWGRADDLATTTLLAADCPVVLAPAMNTRMWEHAATIRNVQFLQRNGATIVGPGVGPLAEREVGAGRMSEPPEILAAVGRAIASGSALAGRHVVVTAGPTRAPIDPVRFIGNRSSGRMGYALAAAAWRRGAEVTLVTGPGHAVRPPGPATFEVETAGEMLAAVEKALTAADILIMAAAVSDFEAVEIAGSKIKKTTGGELDLKLAPAPDILSRTLGARRERGVFTLGFALETDDALENGRRKLERKGLQLIAINDATDPQSGFDVATNRVSLLDEAGNLEEMPVLSKEELADRLLDRVEGVLET